MIGLPSPILVGAHKLTHDFTIDGECAGDVFYAFDLLEIDAADFRSIPYERRFVHLSSLFNRPDVKQIEFVETAKLPSRPEWGCRWATEVGLPGGIAVRFSASASAQWIGSVVQALQRPC